MNPISVGWEYQNTGVTNPVLAGYATDLYYDPNAGGVTSGTPYQFYISGTVAPVPEPSTWAMIGIGFAGLGLLATRGRKTAAAVA